MKLTITIATVLGALVVLFYGAYYIINPDTRAPQILDQLAIPHPAVIAHRGASVVAPESTTPAYEIAARLGSDYLEADVQRSADGELIIFHDSDLRRTSNVSELFPRRQHDPVGSFTLAELRTLDYGSWFNQAFPLRARPEYEGLEILTLRELIAIAESGEQPTGLILESKHPERYPGIEQQIIDTLLAEGWLKQTESGRIFDRASAGKAEHTRTIFFSFSPASLHRLQEIAPEIPRLLLISDTMITHLSWRRWLEVAEPIAHGLGLKGFMAWPWYIAAAHEKQMFVLPYTINYLWQIRVLAQFQASGFITDRPELVLGFLQRLPQQPNSAPVRDAIIPATHR